MFLTHIKFAVRVFLKDKFFSTLNILGLALGIAVSIILLLILQNDLTYDQHHLNYKRIYRLSGHAIATGADFSPARSARELGPILKEEYPEIQEVVRANNWDHTLVKYKQPNGEEKAFYEEDIVRTDSTYFNVFTHEFVSGNPKKCLTELHSVVITESKAKKYFGDDDPMGKVLEINDESWTVTGVIRDVPENTHLKFDILISRLVDREWTKENGLIKSEAFWNPDVYTYLLVNENYNPADFYAKFPKVYDKYFKSFGDKINGKYEPILERLDKIHFYSKQDYDEPHGNLAYLYAFTTIGIFIVLLACINYMNLSTAKSVKRATEIAMKKTFGSGKWALMLSFLTESIFLSFVSLVLAIAVVVFILNVTSFNALIAKNLSLDFLSNKILLLGCIGITLIIGIISGLYPAFYLPRIPTLSAMKGAFKNKASSRGLRKVLITLQFAISIFVVVCTLLMQDQISYVRSRDLGFDNENMLLLPIQDSLVQHQLNGIKAEFSQNPHIIAATTSYDVMGMGVSGPVMWAEGENGMQQQHFRMMFVGEDYFKTLNIPIVEGRDFLPGTKVDTDDVFIANEAAVKLMGWGKDPIGKKVKFYHGTKDGQIIGIVKNFNFTSLHNNVEPLLVIKAREEGGYLYLKLKGNLPETISFIQEKWSKMDPNHPFEYFFLDQRFNDQYKADETQFKLLSGLSYICIFISLLGLLGLSAFTASQRTREIGIRKVHGAGIPGIIYLLYKEVMILVIFSCVLIMPVAYVVINQWLGNFAYQTTLNYFIFIAVGVLALSFSFLTVAFHSLKTASTNPIQSLKYE